MKLLKNKLPLFTSIVFIGFIAWWISFQRVIDNQGISTQWFGGTYGILALIGALIGFYTAQKWGGFRTVLGKALTFFALGLLAQEVGQLIITYYVYAAHVDIPYPSWGDIAYLGSTISYICGAFFLAKAVGVKFSLRNNKYKAIALAIPVVLLSVSFWVFMHNHQYDTSKPITVFLDIAYPVGDALYISLGITAYLLSRKMLGGVMRAGILILIFALIAQYIADFTFLYQSSRATYMPAGYDDLLYLIAYFITTVAMIKFYSVYKNLRVKSGNTDE